MPSSETSVNHSSNIRDDWTDITITNNEKVWNISRITKMWQRRKVGKCWGNGAIRLAWHRVATNLQFVKGKKKCSNYKAIKQSMS